jgi:hypothetical protein
MFSSYHLVDDKNVIYDGFKLAKTKKGNTFTVCDINFQKSNINNKYQARLTFRKTDNEFKERNVNKGTDCIRITFNTSQYGYRELLFKNYNILPYFINSITSCWRKLKL